MITVKELAEKCQEYHLDIEFRSDCPNQVLIRRYYADFNYAARRFVPLNEIIDAPEVLKFWSDHFDKELETYINKGAGRNTDTVGEIGC